MTNPGPWRLTLYVAGTSGRSATARRNLDRICRTHAPEGYEVEVVDLLEHPRIAAEQDILAVPTLVRHHPEPETRLIGDLSDTARVLAGLQLEPGT